MTRTRGRRRALGALACAASLALTASARAQPFTVCATGCSFATISAANASATVHNGDELVVEPGIYLDAPVITKVLSIHGDLSQPRPTIAPTSEFSNAITLEAGSAGSVISHLALEPAGANSDGFLALATGAFDDLTIKAARAFGIGASHVSIANVTATDTSNLGVTAATEGTVITHLQLTWPPAGGGLLLSSFGGAGTVIEDSTFVSPTTSIPLGINVNPPRGQTTLRRVRVEGAGEASFVEGPATLTDSLITARGGPAMEVTNGAAALRNDTLISAGGGTHPSIGVRALGCIGSGCLPGTVSASDLIVRGVARDVQAEAAESSPGAPGAIAIEHSNFLTQAGGVTASATQAADPLFVNGTIGPSENFRLQAGSPAIDAGAVDALTGPTDLDGNPRVQGAAVDLGAYELVPPTPVAVPGPSPAPPPPPGATPKAVAATLALAGRTVKIDRRRGTGALSVRCSAGSGDRCAVVGALTAISHRGKGAATRRTAGAAHLGAVTGTVRGPRTASLRVRITAAALAKLRRLHHLSANLTATVTSAGGVTHLAGAVKLVLAPPARRRGH
ncbi:MAG TPA: choice-of-anchor Q domain-containing protein [Solirubrobacteraceae bacterium]|nr:choice-of-anchor Q domain-containing protein [Solirubrobacteraceae bacterium]